MDLEMFLDPSYWRIVISIAIVGLIAGVAVVLAVATIDGLFSSIAELGAKAEKKARKKPRKKKAKATTVIVEGPVILVDGLDELEVSILIDDFEEELEDDDYFEEGC